MSKLSKKQVIYYIFPNYGVLCSKTKAEILNKFAKNEFKKVDEKIYKRN